VLTILLILLRS